MRFRYSVEWRYRNAKTLANNHRRLASHRSRSPGVLVCYNGGDEMTEEERVAYVTWALTGIIEGKVTDADIPECLTRLVEIQADNARQLTRIADQGEEDLNNKYPNRHIDGSSIAPTPDADFIGLPDEDGNVHHFRRRDLQNYRDGYFQYKSQGGFKTILSAKDMEDIMGPATPTPNATKLVEAVKVVMKGRLPLMIAYCEQHGFAEVKNDWDKSRIKFWELRIDIIRAALAEYERTHNGKI